MATNTSEHPARRKLLVVGALVLVLSASLPVVALAFSAKIQPTTPLARTSQGGGASSSRSNSTTTSSNSKTGLHVGAVSPPKGDAELFNGTFKLRFSTKIKSHSALPKLTPAILGKWSRPNPSTLLFTPSSQLIPGMTITITMPEGKKGPIGTNSTMLRSPFSTRVVVASGPILRVQQMLAELGYLPYSFVPNGKGSALRRSNGALAKELKNPGEVSRTPLLGSSIPRFASIPQQLAATFTPGKPNTATTGAIMAFELEHNLQTDGLAGPLVWQAMLQAVATRHSSSRPYDYLIVSQSLPETLYVWREGKVIYQTPVNTGVEGVTPDGTWPVYLRYLTTTMTGTNPNGSHYSDPGIPWVSYFNGSVAVHGFPRYGYGYPQSAGCVELPINNSKIVFPMDPIGTLVTVTTGDLATVLHVAQPSYVNNPYAASPTTIPPSTTTTSTTTAVPPKHKRKPRPATTTTVAPNTAPTIAPTATSVAPDSSTTTSLP